MLSWANTLRVGDLPSDLKIKKMVNLEREITIKKLNPLELGKKDRRYQGETSNGDPKV